MQTSWQDRASAHSKNWLLSFFFDNLRWGFYNNVTNLRLLVMVIKSLQAKQSPVGPTNDGKAEIGKGQDQIHEWLAAYADSRDPALRDGIIQASLPLVKRIAYGLAR